LQTNYDITADTVRVVDPEGEQLGILALNEAISRAKARGLDLVMMSAKAKPPVCKIMDYGKFKYQESKKANLAKKKQHQVQIKEVKVRSSTDTHDLDVKSKRVVKFLGEGNKVKLSVRFRGREVAYASQGREMLLKMASEVEHLGKIERMPQMEGRQMMLIIAPKK